MVWCQQAAPAASPRRHPAASDCPRWLFRRFFFAYLLLFSSGSVVFRSVSRRDGRAVECTGLENRRRLIAYPGFESLSLHHLEFRKPRLLQVGGAFSLLPRSAHRRHFATLPEQRWPMMRRAVSGLSATVSITAPDIPCRRMCACPSPFRQVETPCHFLPLV